MKKPHTEIQIKMGRKFYHYRDVPISKVKPVLELWADYEEEEWITADEWMKVDIEAAGGRSAYFVPIARRRAGLTQTELAKRLGIPQGNLSQIESGKRPVGKALAKKMEKIFNIGYRVFL